MDGRLTTTSGIMFVQENPNGVIAPRLNPDTRGESSL